MIYLDNAATTWPKPHSVIDAVVKTMEEVGANPGRGGHHMAIEAGRIIYETRDLLAKLFNIKNPSRIVLTKNATEALNIGIQGLLKPGDHVITSSMEHNSVSRPLKHLADSGIEVSKVACNKQGELILENLVKAIRPNTKLIVITHASNVTGTLMPITEVGSIAREHGVYFMVDASQTAGVFPIDVEAMNIDLLAFPGHKSLLGPQGTGGLFIRENIVLKPLLTGGTGGQSELERQPETMPDAFESGTLNTPGFAGLGAGIRFILEEGIDKIREHEARLANILLEGLREIPGITIYGPNDLRKQAAVISINIAGIEAAEFGFVLDNTYGIVARAGLHCAPDAHRVLDTLSAGGTLRFSIGYFNTEDEVKQVIQAVQEIATEISK